MPTAAQFRKLALSMPEAEEKSHFGNPDFRVANKIFAGLSDKERRASLKLTPEIQATVVGDGSPFSPAPGAWGRSGWTFVDLARASMGALADLVEEAWRIVAPKRLVAERDGGGLPVITKKRSARAPSAKTRPAKKRTARGSSAKTRSTKRR